MAHIITHETWGTFMNETYPRPTRALPTDGRLSVEALQLLNEVFDEAITHLKGELHVLTSQPARRR